VKHGRHPDGRRAAEHFQLAVVRLDDFSADGQSQTQTDVARGEKWRGGFLRGFGGEPGAVVLNFDLQALHASTAIGIGVQFDADFRLFRIRLKRVEHDLGERVFERGAVASDHDRFAAIFKLQPGGIGGLMFARFLVGFFNQFPDGKGFRLNVPSRARKRI